MFIHRFWILMILVLSMHISLFSVDPFASCNRGRCDPPFPPLPIAFGEIYTVGTVTQANIAGPTQLTTFNMNGLFSNTIPDHTLDQIAILNSGDYSVTLTIAIEGVDGRDWRFQVAVNGVAQPNIDLQISTEGTTTDKMSGASSGLLSLSAGDIITVLVSQSGGATTLEMESANLNVIRIQ